MKPTGARCTGNSRSRSPATGWPARSATANRGRSIRPTGKGRKTSSAALGLVLNAVVLWNTRYLDAVIEDLRGNGHPVRDEDVARLSPLGHAHLNCLGRYAFTGQPPTGLRPLRDPAAPDDTDGDW